MLIGGAIYHVHYEISRDIGCIFFSLNRFVCHEMWLPLVRFVSFSHTLFPWLSSSVFCEHFRCMALYVSSLDDVKDWLRDVVGA